MLQVSLNPGLGDGSWACLRALCGHDELSADAIGPVAATTLLDRLLVAMPGTTVAPGKAQELAVCDCDRLLAALYVRDFGDRIEGSTTCASCKQAFDLRFSLDDLLARVTTNTSDAAEGPDADGLFTLSDGRRFRLPTAADQQSVAGLDPETATAELSARCVTSGDPNTNPELLQTALDDVAGILDLDLDAQCPECDGKQTVHFDIQSYLLRTLAAEQRFLHREVHTIATVYRWRYQEILDLPREDRRAYVALIQADRQAAAERRSVPL